MKRTFDLIVLGTGAAGTAAAQAGAGAGRRTAIVDARPFGGTCALRGCDPKKVLVGAAQAVAGARRLRGRGVRTGAPAVDWPELMRFKRTFTDPVPASKEKSFLDAGIAPFHGVATFTGSDTVRVGDDRLQAERLVVATGARPAPLGVPGREHLLTSDDFLELDALPPSLVFVGGGYISFEFAHVAARAGAQATIVHRGPRPLESFDPDLVDALLAHSRDLGIRVELGAEVTRITRAGSEVTVHAERDGETLAFTGAAAVHGAGRTPNLEELDLDVAGVAHGREGVVVDRHLRSTTNPAVYAAGDCAAAGLPPLTPTAGLEGSVAIENILHGDRREIDRRAVPSVVFTVPPLARVGLGEEEARSAGIAVEARLQDTSGWYSSRRIHETRSAVKTLVDAATGRILGAHLFGAGAGELVNVFALAIAREMTAGELTAVTFAYPTHGSDVGSMF